MDRQNEFIDIESTYYFKVRTNRQKTEQEILAAVKLLGLQAIYEPCYIKIAEKYIYENTLTISKNQMTEAVIIQAIKHGLPYDIIITSAHKHIYDTETVKLAAITNDINSTIAVHRRGSFNPWYWDTFEESLVRIAFLSDPGGLIRLERSTFLLSLGNYQEVVERVLNECRQGLIGDKRHRGWVIERDLGL